MPPSAQKTDFFLGLWNASTDTFSQLLDLNDQTTFTILRDGLDMPQPEKTVILAGNIRSNGSIATRVVYKERHITVKFSVRGASSDAIIASARTLLSVLELNQFCIKLAWPGESNYSYADVIAVNKADLKYSPQQLLAKAQTGFVVDFMCATGLRGDRQILSNLAVNPGFSAPSNTGINVFNDAFGNVNNYVSQAGGAPTVGSVNNNYPDVVMADAPLRYYRMNEASGTTAYDVSGTGQHATYVASPTLGTASGISGDAADKAVTFNGTSQYATVPLGSGSVALPTGNGNWSIECWFKIAGNPATNARMLCQFGDRTVTRGAPGIVMNTSGQIFATTQAGDTAPTAAVTLNAWHHAAATWDGTTLRIYLDGAAGPTATPGALSIGTHGAAFGAAEDHAAANDFPGVLDEVAIYGSQLSAARVTAHFNAGSAGTGMGTSTNTLTVPAAARASFGSPAWSAYNTWQMRFRFTSGLTFNAYLHYTDANNFLRVSITGSSLKLTQDLAGTPWDLANAATSLAPNVWYWLKVTQFPQPALTGSNLAPGVIATLYDDGPTVGTLGAQLTTTGAVPTQDAVTALSGRPQLEASGAALIMGGNFANTHIVNLFGPGGWFMANASGSSTATASGAWEQSTANTYPNGPITSVGAARIDAPPAGLWDYAWRSYAGGSPAGRFGVPVASAGDVFGIYAYVKSSGLGSSATSSILVHEYDASGASLRIGQAGSSISGTTSNAGWTQVGGAYTTGASCAYLDIGLRATDTSAPGASANATVWFDNLQAWDQTSTGMATMPYCELNMPSSPSQFFVSGVLGDIKAPAHVSMGVYLASWAAGGPALTYVLGRRAQSSANPMMVSPLYGGLATNMNKVPVLSSTSYGGYFWTITGTFAQPFYLNMLGTSSRAADMLGAYHLFGLTYSTETSGANIAKVTAQTNPGQTLNQWLSAGGAINNVAVAYGGVNSPLTAQNTWTLTDFGYLQIPAFPQGGLIDPTANTWQQTYSLLIDTNGTNGQIIRSNFAALIPVDGEALLATAYIQPSSNTITTKWHFVYADGSVVNRGGGADSAAWTFSDEAGALANPASGYGGAGPASITVGTTLALGTPNINPAGDPFMYLDPTIDSGSNANQMGVNEMAGLVCDSTGALYPMIVEVRYSPLYLEPR